MRTTQGVAIVALVMGLSAALPGTVLAQDPPGADPATNAGDTTTTSSATTTTPADPTTVFGAPDDSSTSTEPHTKAAKAAANQVDMKNIAFNPQNLTIGVGDKVTWTNLDAQGIKHDATATKGHENWTGTLNHGDSGSHTFNQAGTYKYFCSFHAATMKGTITVKGSSGGGGSGGGGSDPSAGSSSTGGTSGGTSSGSSGFGPGSESFAGGSPGASGSSSTLPKTGQPLLPLVLAAGGLLGLGLLVRWAAYALYYRGW